MSPIFRAHLEYKRSDGVFKSPCFSKLRLLNSSPRLHVATSNQNIQTKMYIPRGGLRGAAQYTLNAHVSYRKVRVNVNVYYLFWGKDIHKLQQYDKPHTSDFFIQNDLYFDK